MKADKCKSWNADAGSLRGPPRPAAVSLAAAAPTCSHATPVRSVDSNVAAPFECLLYARFPPPGPRSNSLQTWPFESAASKLIGSNHWPVNAEGKHPEAEGAGANKMYPVLSSSAFAALHSRRISLVVTP